MLGGRTVAVLMLLAWGEALDWCYSDNSRTKIIVSSQCSAFCCSNEVLDQGCGSECPNQPREYCFQDNSKNKVIPISQCYEGTCAATVCAQPSTPAPAPTPNPGGDKCRLLDNWDITLTACKCGAKYRIPLDESWDLCNPCGGGPVTPGGYTYSLTFKINTKEQCYGGPCYDVTEDNGPDGGVITQTYKCGICYYQFGHGGEKDPYSIPLSIDCPTTPNPILPTPLPIPTPVPESSSKSTIIIGAAAGGGFLLIVVIVVVAVLLVRRKKTREEAAVNADYEDVDDVRSMVTTAK